nr:MAG TPA: hypothetical protein [Caudoviricetes sp.]
MRCCGNPLNNLVPSAAVPSAAKCAKCRQDDYSV